MDVSPEEAARDLELATPLFLAKLDAANLRARGCETLAQYLRQYRAAIGRATPDEHARVAAAAARVRRACRREAALAHLARVPWRFAKSLGDGAEGGMPHTVGAVVVLPERALREGFAGLDALIVHELCHIFQRREPALARQQATALGFLPRGAFARHGLSGRLRANPDTDLTVYSLHGQEVNAVLRPHARSLSDTEPRARYADQRFALCNNHEHPFEILAELCEKAFARAQGRP